MIYFNSGVASTGPAAAGPLAARALLPMALPPAAADPSAAPDDAFVAMFAGLGATLVYLDAAEAWPLAQGLAAAGVPHVIAWPANQAPPALHSMHFAHAFFAALRCPGMSISEGFAIAAHLTRAAASTAGGPAAPPLILPQLVSLAAAALPDSASVPPYVGPAAPLGRPLHEVFPGYAQLRMCAPHAELSLMIAALPEAVNSDAMSCLCEALRAVLVAEVRTLRLLSSAPGASPPAYLPVGSVALRCECASASGYGFSVVLGGPQEVLAAAGVAEHGLRQTVAADAQALQFKLPPGDAPLPPLRAVPGVAGGAPVVEALAVTSVWAVQLLKQMAADPESRILVAAGVGAVSTTPTAAFSKADGNRAAAVACGGDKARLVPQPAAQGVKLPVPGARPPLEAVPRAVMPSPAAIAAATAAIRVAQAAAAAGKPIPGMSPLPAASPAVHVALPVTFQPPAVAASEAAAPAAAAAPPWDSARPPLASCTEQDFLADLAAFLEARQGRAVDPAAFPEASLNGTRLDVYGLYREVCARGGYRAAANRIDWRGDVYPALKNYTPEGKVTAVGNVLKHHYQALLLDYEAANQRDVGGGGAPAAAAATGNAAQF